MRDAALLKEKAQLFFLNAKPAGKKLFFKKVFFTRQGAQKPLPKFPLIFRRTPPPPNPEKNSTFAKVVSHALDTF